MSKFWGLFLMPIIASAMLALFWILPKLDPLKKNYKDFNEYYEGFIVMMLAYLFYIYLITIFWNLGKRLPIAKFMTPAFTVFFWYIGMLLSKAKKNWFVGIRTPWTMENEAVWNKTHAIGGKLFKMAGSIALLGLFLPASWAFWLVIGPVIFVSLFLIGYSYWLYRTRSVWEKIKG